MRLRDTRTVKTSMQVQLEINRFCGNSSLVYFLRTMPYEATRQAAHVHDALIARAFHCIVGTAQASEGQRSRAAEQMRLPVRMGGLGVTSQAAIQPAAVIGTWALCWRPLQQLSPQLFADVDIATSKLPALRELQRAHEDMLARHERIDKAFKLWDNTYYDYDKEGEGHTRFHPSGLPPRKKLLPLSEFGSTSEYLQNAQRTYSQIAHNSAWWGLAQRLQGISMRELVRFISVSQACAGAYLNAVPKFDPFRLHTWAMRIAVQRRLGLPLTAAATAHGGLSRHGMVFDNLGDVAQNDGEAGHSTRHSLVLQALVKVLKSVWGGQVRMEPTDYAAYSDTRPDLAAEGLGVGGSLLVGDLKMKDPIGSAATPAARGGFVSFGNTLPPAREYALGRRERGTLADGPFNSLTGKGYVAPKTGQYTRALELGVDCRALLVETFGGLSPPLMELLRVLAKERQNRLNRDEYDDTTWAARTWLSFSTQKLAVAIQRAVALEMAHALGLATAVDPRSTGRA